LNGKENQDEEGEAPPLRLLQAVHTSILGHIVMASFPGSELGDMVKKHEEEIEELKVMFAGKLPADNVTADGVLIDDVFFLRFLLSNKKIDRAAEKIVETLEWRHTNKDLLISLSQGGKHPLEAELTNFLFSGYTGSLAGGEPVSVVRMGISDFRVLMNSYDIETIAEYLLFEKEKMFRFCDAESRSRKVIVKAITVIDFSGFSMFGGKFDNRFFSALGASSKLSSIYFPQLQLKTVAINTPSYYGMVDKALRQVMPKSSMEKMVICPAKKTDQNSISGCPFMSAHLGAAAVPPCLGGTGKTPIELVPPNEREGEVPFQALSVKSRSYAMVELQIDVPGTMVEFEVNVRENHVLMSAELVQYKSESREFRKFNSGMSDDSGDDLKVEHHKVKRRPNWKIRIAKPTKETGNIKTAKRLSLNPTMVALKLASKDGFVRGTWKMPYAGKLFIKFDNSFSMIRAKKVTYRITTVPPPESAEEQSWWEANWGEFAKQAQWPQNEGDDWACTIQ